MIIQPVHMSLGDMTNFQIMHGQRPRKNNFSENMTRIGIKTSCCCNLQLFVVCDFTVLSELHLMDWAVFLKPARLLEVQDLGKHGSEGSCCNKPALNCQGTDLLKLNNQQLLTLRVPFLPWPDTIFPGIILLHVHLNIRTEPILQ